MTTLRLKGDSAAHCSDWPWAIRWPVRFRIPQVLKAINLGEHINATATITGALAGAFYSEGSIPRDCVAQVSLSNNIRRLTEHLHEAGLSS